MNNYQQLTLLNIASVANISILIPIIDDDSIEEYIKKFINKSNAVFQINMLKTILDIMVPVKISMSFVDKLVKPTYKRNELSLLNAILSNGRLNILIDNYHKNTRECLDDLEDKINVKKI